MALRLHKSTIAIVVTVKLIASVGFAAAQTKPPASTPPAKPALSPPPTVPAPAQPGWEGRWSGSFGARADISVTFAGERMTGVLFLGQPMTVTTTSVTGGIATMSGPDFSMTLTRIGPSSAQGIYENNRKEKAAVLLSRN